MAADNPLADPIGHSTDTDLLHLPGGSMLDVHDWTATGLRQFVGEDFYHSMQAWGFDGLSKFMFLELVAVVICLAIFIPLAYTVGRRGYAKGVFANFLETMLVFLRDTVAIPAIGEHDADKHVPFLWSMFFFILVNNLLGILPVVGGSPTGALGTTMALALCTFIWVHWSGVAALGPVGYGKAFVPHVPAMLYPLMFVIELVGHIIKPVVLAVRLFVNMLAGHTVLFVILAFIAVIGPNILYFLVTPMSVIGVVLLSLLELFVAFLQAYVFTFLSAIFIGMAVHPQH